MAVKFGIIGFGFMGHVHEDNITNKVEGGEVVAICDIDKEAMNDAKTEGVKKYDNYNDLLANSEVEAVIVVIPNHLHKDCVIAAANAGKNIICEKPVALNSAELDEMLEAVEKNNVRFTVHQQRRFDKDYRKIKKVYDEKKIGKVYTIQSMLYGYNGNVHDWHVHKKYGGGMIYDWGVHLFDQMLYMVDSKIVSVFADVRNVINEEVDDYFKVILCFENGITAEIEMGTYFLTDKERWFERHWFIGGNEGSAYTDGFVPVGKVVKTAHLLRNVGDKNTEEGYGPTRSFFVPEPGLLLTDDLPEVEVAHTMYYENFIEAIETGSEFLVKIPEIKRVMKLMEAIRESSEKKQSIAFE